MLDGDAGPEAILVGGSLGLAGDDIKGIFSESSAMKDCRRTPVQALQVLRGRSMELN
jgi:hypothetical protein